MYPARSLIFVTFLFVGASVVGALQPTLHHELSVRLDPEAHRIEVKASAPSEPGLIQRVSNLEAEVERLRRQLEGLATRLGQPLDE